MASKTRMRQLVRDLRWRDIEAELQAAPELLHVRDDRGRSWLHLMCAVDASTRGLREADAVRCADLLIDAGLDVNDPAFVEGTFRATPLWFAVAHGKSLRLVKHLLERGSSPEHCLWAAAYRDDLPTIRVLVAAGATIDPVTENVTPLGHAVKTGRFRAAKALLEGGADPDFQDAGGRTALHHLLRRNPEVRHVRMLVDAGARGDLQDGDGRTAIDILQRKRAPAFRELAERLAGA